ncbi:DUF2460 domain-containing protein [Rubellimicrobium aerolatum]|uniref:TIGR02217 family protein n=1 Tax=Rubellimicrobium aerolatum TaxID=490979 RepID=A0ABW0SB87_9RHOB|nr:DUF2460 domain-containing protein [Rubellimicrobium aerolatum]MBP1805505.1 uncharacterized protein (TIGR02217 family) [Rubellimicrobium aerolatum]
MSFHETRFPTALSFGAQGGPERRTEIVTLSNGWEERNSPWSQSRRRYDAGLGLRSLDDLHALLAFWEARMGQLHGFRWKDWADHKSCAPSVLPGPLDQEIGTGDGTTRAFQLRKAYASGGVTHWRTIRKPVAGTVRVAVAGQESTGWTLDPATGLVTFATAPAAGAAITAGFEFDVPVRFDADAIRVQVSTFQAGEVPSVPVIEVRA